MMTYHGILKQLLEHSENEIVEFKAAHNNYDIDELGKYFSALSNEANLREREFAWIVFGVENKTHEIVGTSFKDSEQSLNKLKHDMSQHTTDNLIFREIEPIMVEGKRVLMFKVPASPRNTVMHWKGIAWARDGESLKPLNQTKRDEIRNQAPIPDWSAQLVPSASINDLDDLALATARVMYKKVHGSNISGEEVDSWSMEEFLSNSNMMRDANGSFVTPTSELFEYSEDFVNNYLPYTVELGRAFVQPEYQPSTNLRKGLYSLDNLWDGLGAIALEIPETRYFFGKITMYPQMNSRAKDMVRFFMLKHFPDANHLVKPFEAMPITMEQKELESLFDGKNYKEDYQILTHSVRALGSVVPPMINAYITLSPTMRCFGTAENKDFGNTDETGILVAIKEIIPEKRARYMESYDTKNHVLDRPHLFRINMKMLPWWKQVADEEREELRRLKRLKQQAAQEVRAQRKKIRQERREVRRSLMK